MQQKLNPYLLVLIVYVVLGYYLYSSWLVFANSNFFVASITFVVGSLAFYIYTQQKNDAKRDAARIIIQEIRRAEEIINDYKQMGAYKFSKKIIATNSWSKNIHYFVGDLDNDELDRISDIYSTGEYLDSLIKDISTLTFNHEIETGKQIVKMQMLAPPVGSGQGVHIIPELPNLPPVWRGRLDLISKELEPIYHSTIMLKLKKIANLE